VALLRQQLLVHRDFTAWLNQPFAVPPGLVAVGQVALEFA